MIELWGISIVLASEYGRVLKYSRHSSGTAFASAKNFSYIISRYTALLPSRCELDSIRCRKDSAMNNYSV